LAGGAEVIGPVSFKTLAAVGTFKMCDEVHRNKSHPIDFTICLPEQTNLETAFVSLPSNKGLAMPISLCKNNLGNGVCPLAVR
jgi:hypothetical protein